MTNIPSIPDIRLLQGRAAYQHGLTLPDDVGRDYAYGWLCARAEERFPEPEDEFYYFDEDGRQIFPDEGEH